MKARIGAAALQQLCMAALLDDVATLHDQDRVRVADGGQTVGDDEARAATPQRPHGPLHQELGSRVNRTGGLVQDEDGGIRDEGPGDGEQLTLAGRDIGGLLLQDRLVALGQRPHGVVDVAGARGRLHLLVRGAGTPVADVLADRALEEPRVLQHHAGARPHVAPAHGGNVHAVEGDATAIDVVEAHEEVDQGGLAGPRGPHDGDSLAGLDAQRQVADELDVGVVGEADAVHLDHSAVRGPRCLLGRRARIIDVIGALLLGVEKLEDPLGAGRAGLDGGGHPAELPQGLGELLGVLDERLHVAQAQAAARDHEPAEDRDHDIGQIPDDLHDRHHEAGQELGAQAGAVELLVLGVEPLARVPHTTVGAHQGVTGEGLLDTHVQTPGLGPLHGEGLLGARPDDTEHDGHERQDDQRRQGQLPRDRQHHGHHPEHGQNGPQRAGQRLLKRVGDVVDVVGDAAEQFAALDAVEVGQRQVVDLGLDVCAQPEHRPDRDAVEDEALEPGQHGRTDVDRQGEQQDPAQSAVIDARAGQEIHGADHVRHLAVARGDQALDRLLLGRARRQAGADGALEDDVGGTAQDFGGDHGQDDGDDGSEPRHHELDPEGSQQSEHAGEGGPEGIGLARRRTGTPVIRGGLSAGRQREVLLAEPIDGGRSGGGGGISSTHAAASLPSWEVTISR